MKKNILQLITRYIPRKLSASFLLCIIGLSLKAAVPTDTVSPCHHDFAAKQLIVPGTLIATGAMGFLEPVKNWEVGLRNDVREHRTDKTTVDNYIQYVPTVLSVVGDWVGAEAKHNFLDRILLVGTSCLITTTLVNSIKYTVASERPGVYDEIIVQNNPKGRTPQNTPKAFNSFPSGHSATAFVGAELVRLEYGEDSPWLAAGAYAIAASTSAMRIWNEKHWFTDVLAGAGFGILSARIGWWLLPWVSRVADNTLRLDATHPKTKIAVNPMTDGHQVELALSISFQ